MLARLSVAVGFLVLVACVAPAVTVDSGSVHRLTLDLRWSARPLVLVFVVDDAQSAEAAALRSGIVAELRSTLRRIQSMRQAYDGALVDPAAWHPVDLRAVVVHPSAASTTAVAPSDDARFAWVSTNGTDAELDVFTAAIAAEIDRGSSPGSPFRPIDSAMQTVRLAAGDRSPVDARERALVASLPSGFTQFAVLVATTRDDEGSESLADEALGDFNTVHDYNLDVSLVSSLATPSSIDDCSARELAASRLHDWIAPEGRLGGVTAWPCASSVLARQTLFPPTFSSEGGVQYCLSSPIARLSSGQPACLLTWTRASLEACETARGFLDPLASNGKRRGVVVTYGGGSTARTCEIAALTGSAESACRSTLACEGCGAGWCRTEVPSLASTTDRCLSSDFRFVGGAEPSGFGWLTVTCDLAR